MTTQPIRPDQIWKYMGPHIPGPQGGLAPSGQLHLVTNANRFEVVTIGIPYGHGGSFLCTAQEFMGLFQFWQEKL